MLLDTFSMDAVGSYGSWSAINGNATVPDVRTSGKDSETDPLWSAVIDVLLKIRDLRDDWDGDNAVAPTKATVDSALHLAIKFRDLSYRTPVRVVPGRMGSVIFEWSLPGTQYYEIEVVEPFMAESTLLRPGHPPAHFIFRDAKPS